MTTTPEQLLVLTRGLPASGKSTWAKQWLAENPSTRTRVNRDNLRFETYGLYWFGVDKKAFQMEDNITKLQRVAIREALRAGRSVIVDDTNMDVSRLGELINIAKEFNSQVQIQIQDFPVDTNELIRRDTNRISQGQRGVGAEVIKKLAQRYLHGGKDLPKLPMSYYETL